MKEVRQNKLNHSVSRKNKATKGVHETVVYILIRTIIKWKPMSALHGHRRTAGMEESGTREPT